MKVKILRIRLSENDLISDQKELDNFLAKHDILKVETAFVSNESYWSVIIYFDEIKSVIKESASIKYTAKNESLTPDEIKILDSLKTWRTEKAKKQNLPTYFIATNDELLSVAKFKPIKKEELLEIKGFGKYKIENYGAEIIEILENA